MLVCCCSNPSCMVNGCQQAAELQRKYYVPKVAPTPMTFHPQPLSADDIRRIVREEIERSRKEV